MTNEINPESGSGPTTPVDTAERILPGLEGRPPLVITDFTPTEIVEALPPRQAMMPEVQEIRAFYIDKIEDPDVDDFDMRPVILPASAVVDVAPKDSSVTAPASSLASLKQSEV